MTLIKEERPELPLDDTNTVRLKAVVADIEVGALIRVLQVFQERTVSPRKVSAQRILLRSQDREVLHIEVEFAVSNLTTDALRLIAAKIAQLPITLSTVFGQGNTPQPLMLATAESQSSQSHQPDNG